MANEKTGLELLRVPFEAHHIKKLPKPTKKQTEDVAADYKKGIRCAICSGWHHPDVIHLPYVGHAALTDRLLNCDSNWNWKPFAVDSTGYPVIDKDGGMWIELTVCGVTRMGYGDAQGKTGGNATKERIGDALRNAAMRFGAALDLWHKGDLHLEEEPQVKKVEPPQESAKSIAASEWDKLDKAEQEFLQEIANKVILEFETMGTESASKALEKENLDNEEMLAIWSRFDSKLRSSIKAYQLKKREEENALLTLNMKKEN